MAEENGNPNPGQVTDPNTGTGDGVGGDDAAKAAAAAAAAAAADAEGKGSTGAPDAYADFTLPEGVSLEQTVLDTYKTTFKELGLPQDKAQQFIDTQVKLMQAGVQSQMDAYNQQLAGWQAEVKSDKDIGGDKLEESLKVMSVGLSKFGSPELAKLLEDTGLIHHPQIVRAFHKIGRALQEDKPLHGGAVATKKDAVARMYPDATS